ncbi:MAG: class I SAM-dependent methyltransferase [Myxococcales bacterium]|nr:class I SAM-dependent methyltransferase [Myxococcales bacterium]
MTSRDDDARASAPPAAAFPDHFSDASESYARYRPRYPDALYERLASVAPGRALCWDCATGSGQAAVALAERFDAVVATDASAEQLASARPHPRVEYRHERAERTSLAPASVELVTVAAALHWFELSSFYAEVRRVVRPGGVLAAWTYGVSVETSPAVDAIVDEYARELLGPYWAPQLEHVRERYRGLPFPFAPIELPPLAIELEWTLAQLLGKLNTWSAAGAYRRAHGRRATAAIEARLAAAWERGGPADVARAIRLPLYFRVGRVG